MTIKRQRRQGSCCRIFCPRQAESLWNRTVHGSDGCGLYAEGRVPGKGSVPDRRMKTGLSIHTKRISHRRAYGGRQKIYWTCGHATANPPSGRNLRTAVRRRQRDIPFPPQTAERASEARHSFPEKKQAESRRRFPDRAYAQARFFCPSVHRSVREGRAIRTEFQPVLHQQ